MGIERAVWEWLKSCPVGPGLPLEAEFLPVGRGLALQVVEPAHVTRRFILGGQEGRVRFAIVYRLSPSSSEERLEAGETLERLGRWAAQPENWPGELRLRRVEPGGAALKERRPDGTEDWEIMLTLEYEGQAE